MQVDACRKEVQSVDTYGADTYVAQEDGDIKETLAAGRAALQKKYGGSESK